MSKASARTCRSKIPVRLVTRGSSLEIGIRGLHSAPGAVMFWVCGFQGFNHSCAVWINTVVHMKKMKVAELLHFRLDAAFPRTFMWLGVALRCLICVAIFLFTVETVVMAHALLDSALFMWGLGIYPGPGMSHVDGFVAMGIGFAVLAPVSAYFLVKIVRLAIRGRL